MVDIDIARKAITRFLDIWSHSFVCAIVPFTILVAFFGMLGRAVFYNYYKYYDTNEIYGQYNFSSSTFASI